MRPLLLAAFFASALTARAALNLSPSANEFDGEGVKYTQLAFTDDQRKVLYVPPQNWSYRGSAAQLLLTPPAIFNRAAAVIETAALATPQPLDAKGIELVRRQFASTLPPGSQGIKVLSEESSPVLINGNIATYEITASYELFGETFLRSVLFSNVSETTQLRFKLTALKKDFDVLHRQFRASLVSWQWSEPAPPSAGSMTASR